MLLLLLLWLLLLLRTKGAVGVAGIDAGHRCATRAQLAFLERQLRVLVGLYVRTYNISYNTARAQIIRFYSYPLHNKNIMNSLFVPAVPVCRVHHSTAAAPSATQTAPLFAAQKIGMTVNLQSIWISLGDKQVYC